MKQILILLLLLTVRLSAEAQTTQKPWLRPVVQEAGEGKIELTGDAASAGVWFLRFGNHSYEPDWLILEKKELDQWVKVGDQKSVVIGNPLMINLFQELKAVRWMIPESIYQMGAAYRFRVGRKGGTNGKPDRDGFWDQIIVVEDSILNTDPVIRLKNIQTVETGKFGDALPAHIQKINFTPEEIKSQMESLTDPVMEIFKTSPNKELSWEELESKALPLDYQKILLAGVNDPDPGFAYQNGQWFVTWNGSDGSQVKPEFYDQIDSWFAPAIGIGKEVIRPAPLSARTSFYKDQTGRYLPLLTVEWVCPLSNDQEIKITQRLFEEEMDGVKQLFVSLKMENAPSGAHFIIGHGIRPNTHYWDHYGKTNTPVPFFTDQDKPQKKGDFVLQDEINSVVLRANVPFLLVHSGVTETMLDFEAGYQEVYLAVPQTRTDQLTGRVTPEDFLKAYNKFVGKWNGYLSKGATAELPSAEWDRKIDSWLSQVNSITKIQNGGQEQLSYGAYLYKAFFGIEEGWPIMALAQWGKAEEAKQEADIILSKGNLDKSNYHHQYRNGLSSWYAATVAQLTGDREWLRKISPALVTNGNWTIGARKEMDAERSMLGRGLLSSHIYGGDVSTPAYSLYSSATCLKGLIETADVFKKSNLPELQSDAGVFDKEAVDFQKRLIEVFHEVLNTQSTPPFLPLALELEHKVGNYEKPYPRLTDDHLGNYWNLFAPMFLHLGILRYNDPQKPSQWITDYLENRGGLYAGLPRFYSGLDAVYSVGYTDELLERSKIELTSRSKALASMQSFMINASSSNGNTIPEVSGLFPERLNQVDYERVVRESPWNFGMYNVDRYLRGYNSFTEPLGAGAGEGLLLIRKSLIDEMKDERGLPDGGVFFLSSVPGDWLKEGKEIKLTGFPTAYGTFNLHVKSFINSKRQIQVDYKYTPVLGKDPATGKDLLAWNTLDKILIRLVPSAEDLASIKKLKIKGPLVSMDEWTIQLPVKEEGHFMVKF